jgi:hypothetical protein
MSPESICYGTEIKGEKIQKLCDTQVKKRVHATKYTESLELLVADTATYKYYNQQNKSFQQHMFQLLNY